MEEWVYRALAKWPNVPHLYGWLRLDRRGQWLIRGAAVTRPQIVDTMNANYEADERGRWFYQNGPQRGYVALDYTPLVLHTDTHGELFTHTGLKVTQLANVCMDEEGALTLATEHGPGVIHANDLDWALQHMHTNGGRPLDESHLETALARPSGNSCELQFQFRQQTLTLTRCDFEALPERFAFVRAPQP